MAVFAAYYPPHHGGYERAVSELSERLAAGGLEVTVVTCQLGSAPEIEVRRGVRVVRLPSWQLLGGTYVIPKPTLSTLRLLRIALAEAPDLIHTHTRFFPTSFLGLVVAAVKDVPLVHTEHGAGHSALGSPFLRLVGELVDHSVGRLLMRRAHVIAISRAAAEFCRHLGADNAAVIPDGVDTEMFHRRPSSFRDRYGIGSDELVVCFVGRLVYGKGVQDLLAAWPQVKLGDRRVRLVIVGSGPMLPFLKELSRGQAESVIFTGALSSRGVVDVLCAADIFVSPTHTEGLGLSIIEAAAVGLPVVATGVGGVLDVVEHGVTGLLVAPGDPHALAAALRLLVADGGLRQRIGMAARTAAQTRFDWQLTTSRYLGVLGSVGAAANGTEPSTLVAAHL